MNYQLLEKMAKYKIDSSLQKETKAYMKDVLEHLTNVGVIENVDTAALSMLAKNYDTFILCNQ
jgi:Mg2+ and Co2+ transporter CorA